MSRSSRRMILRCASAVGRGEADVGGRGDLLPTWAFNSFARIGGLRSAGQRDEGTDGPPVKSSAARTAALATASWLTRADSISTCSAGGRKR